jgi:hypothetical protein
LSDSIIAWQKKVKKIIAKAKEDRDRHVVNELWDKEQTNDEYDAEIEFDAIKEVANELLEVPEIAVLFREIELDSLYEPEDVLAARIVNFRMNHPKGELLGERTAEAVERKIIELRGEVVGRSSGSEQEVVNTFTGKPRGSIVLRDKSVQNLSSHLLWMKMHKDRVIGGVKNKRKLSDDDFKSMIRAMLEKRVFLDDVDPETRVEILLRFANRSQNKVNNARIFPRVGIELNPYSGMWQVSLGND